MSSCVRSSARAQGDAEAFAWFFAAEYQRVVRALSHVVRREDAEDVAQEAFIRLHQRWAKVSRYEQPDAWVRRVALNLALSLAKREAKRPARERGANPVPIRAREICLPDPSVRAALAGLPPKQRALVMLFYYEDRPLTQAAEILGISHGAAKVALYRARRQLAAQLEEEVADGSV